MLVTTNLSGKKCVALVWNTALVSEGGLLTDSGGSGYGGVGPGWNALDICPTIVHHPLTF